MIIIHNNKLKKIINEDWRFFIITLASYKSLVNNHKILKNNEYENELIIKIKFLSILKDELNENNMLNIESIEIYDEIQRKCWKRKPIQMNGILIGFYPAYFDIEDKNNIINYYNKKIKYSNQKRKKHIIDNNFKTNNEKKQYENWKQNYFKNINENIIKNNIEQATDAWEYFKSEINSIKLENQLSSDEYTLNIPKI